MLFDLDGEDDKPGAGQGGAPDRAATAAAEEREARDRAEKERAAEAERDRAERARQEQERQARERAEQERLAQEQAEQARIAREREDRARAEAERLERERTERDRAERERAEAERVERERVERERAEQARKEREQAEWEQAERERVARERAERERQERERAEAERTARERAEAERAERDRVERDRAEQARKERERAERERQDRERAEAERAEAERREQERRERARVEQERERAEREARARVAAPEGPRRESRKARAPRLFETDAAEAPVSPASAPPVPDADALPEGRAMQAVVALAARPPSRLGRFFWASFTALIGFAVSLAAWDFVTGLIGRNPVLGGIAVLLAGCVLLALLLIGLREMAAFSRLARLDRLHAETEAALATHDLTAARAVLDRLLALYARREDTLWGRERVKDRQDEILDADGLLGLAERELLAPLDAAATREIEAASRTVAAVTAIVPLALADIATAMVANLRMIRRIAEIYGGRGGFLGSIRLGRAVMTHLVATGAVAVGDDMLGSIAGGGVLSRVSRRFGEGVVNGALTARVGVAAMEVCRPLPFRELKRPSVGALVKRALTGLFSKPDA
ncbi:hypothetical protein GCM10008966_14730 [Rhodovulum strictum]